MSTSEMATVLAWNDALSEKNLGTLVDLSSDDIEIGDSGGAAQGLDALQEWARTFPSTITVGRVFVHDGTVVAEQTLGDGSTVASAFRVVHDQVTAVFRHDDLEAALAATDLTEDDQE
ncbi:MAG: nuclear transport factor 2 family protein [Mycobacterium sp.]